MAISPKQHFIHSKSPETFMKEHWITFDVFESKTYKNVTPFDYQLEFIRNIHNIDNNIVVKGRQMHVSSMMALYIAWYVIFNHEKNVLILSHSSESSKRILDQVKIIIQSYSVCDMFQGADSFITNTKTELRLKNRCRVRAIGPSVDAGRGCTIDLLYVDEAAFVKNFEEIYMGIGMTMHAIKGAKSIIASTPKDNSLFNKLFLNAGDDSFFNPIRLHWSIHPFYSKGISEDKDRESPFKYTSPWFEDLFINIYGSNIDQVQQEVDCVVRHQEEINKVKTISLRVDGSLHKKIQDRLSQGESISDYIRGLIEKDLRTYM